MENMDNIRQIRRVSLDDPKLRHIAQELSQESKEASLTDAEREQFRGKLLAVSVETGEVIAFADNRQALEDAVEETQFKDRDWRLIDGPMNTAPMTVKDLRALMEAP